MKVIFAPIAWSDYLFWQEHDREMVSRINELIRDARRAPFKGIGNPEPLRDDLKGWWSRRMNREHRFVYRVGGSGDAQFLEISSCRFHYRR